MFERMNVAVRGKNVPMKEVAQIGMPNPQTLVFNMVSHPEVGT